MREIKFRAWDKVYNHFHEGDLIRDYVIGEFIDNPQYEVTQYTGLRDEEGNPVYEGDIYQYNVDVSNGKSRKTFKRTDVVAYHDGAFWVGDFLLAEALDKDDGAKIVGNIYENPELKGESE